eukprot:2342674-Pleurochrysis_carterae.AAC.1
MENKKRRLAGVNHPKPIGCLAGVRGTEKSANDSKASIYSRAAAHCEYPMEVPVESRNITL